MWQGLARTREGEPVSPEALALVVEQPDTTVEIDHSIVGATRTVRGVTVKVRNSIVDATADTGVAFSHPDGMSAGGAFIAENTTIIGKVNTTRMELASNPIFFARLAETDTRAHPVDRKSTRLNSSH